MRVVVVFIQSTYTETHIRKDQTGFLLFKTSVCVLGRVKLGLGVTLQDGERAILRQKSLET